MKILSAAQMRDIDRLTIEAGIPGLILMENAAHRVVEQMERRFSPIADQRIAVFCGKGNNGGDGLAIARQLQTRFRPRTLDVILAGPIADLRGEAAQNLEMLRACGIQVQHQISPRMRHATLVVDALLGTGMADRPKDRPRELIDEINTGFPFAKVIAVDLPSGMVSDAADSMGPIARADLTITFTAPKICHVLSPNCDRCGELVIAPIGTDPAIFEQEPLVFLSMMEPRWFHHLFTPRSRSTHKGDYGHVFAIGGSVGKNGAAAMTGSAALRSGAGLVTVASAASAISGIGAHAPELMTEPLAETEAGSIAARAYSAVEALSARKTIVAAGPGMGTHPDTITFCQTLFERMPLPAVLDADAINALIGPYVRPGGPRILTPHPGEMARLIGGSIEQVQSDRIGIARAVALDREVTIVLKGYRTVIAFPDGRVWINTTGTPAMATGGTGDILTGLIAGLMAQFQSEADYAIGAAVWLHGRAGELGAAALGEKCLLATDLLRFLPEAMRELANLSD